MGKPGRFVSFEGPEGAGKTTHIRELEAFLNSHGIRTIRTREPGGTKMGEVVRNLLQNDLAGEPPVDRAEVMLFSASRAQLVENVIRPALAYGVWVLADRFADSTYAYQGYGRGFDVEELRRITMFATGGLEPDITFLLDVPPEITKQRLLDRQAESATGPDRIERAGDAFHLRVREGFLKLAEDFPERMVKVDSQAPRDIVTERIESIVSQRFGIGM